MKTHPFTSTLAAVILVGLASFVGCQGKQSESASSAQHEGGLHIGLVLDLGGREQNVLNASALRGAEEARQEMGITLETAEPSTPEERKQELERLAGMGLDLVIAIGYAATSDVNEVALAHPDVRFACVDYGVEGDDKSIPFNVRALLFRSEEGAFLAGAVAGYMTRTGRIGFVGAMETPSVKRYRAGFIQGVKHVNDRAEVQVRMVGDTPAAFLDTEKAKSIALQLYDDGVDIIFHAAGPAGRGVLDAAVEKEKAVISADGDEMDAAPGRVLTCVVKHVDRAVKEAIHAVGEGSFMGGVSRMGLLSGGVELLLDERAQAIIPERVRLQLDVLRRQIMSKRIEVRATEERRPPAPGDLDPAP